jgi:uncharacterized membrane protein
MISVGNKDVPEIAAMFLMAMLLSLNFYSTTSISYVLGNKIDLGLDSGLKIGICYFLLATLLYFSFVHKKKYLEIAKSFENETSKEKNRGKAFAISYFVLSIGLMIFCFYLMIKKNRGEL